MSQDDADYFRRRFSVGSDRTLDNLAELNSLSTSQNTVFSPSRIPQETMSNGLRGQRPGDSSPPHHHHHHHNDGSSLHPSGSGHELVEVTAPTQSPVRRLRMRSDQNGEREDQFSRSAPVERELTDTYIETLSRTPRYNTYTDYNEMVDNMAAGDPFQGDYKPSGKSKTAHHKRKKHKHHKDSDLQMDEMDGSPPKKSESFVSKKKKKSKKGSSSRDSTGTFTIEGHSNPSFERSRDLSLERQERESVQSNGTYTLAREDSLGSLPTTKFHPSVTRRTTANTMSSIAIKRSSKRKSKQGIDRVEFARFVKEQQIQQREPKENVDSTKMPSGVGQSRVESSKHIWHYHTHTSTETCNSYGEIQFHGFGHDTESSPYIRLANDTNPELVLEILLNIWKLPTPKLLISVTGGAKRFDIKPKLLEKFTRGLINAATSTGAWIITGGTNTGVMEIVGNGVRDHIITYGKRNDVVCLGVPLWGILANRDALDDGEDGNFPAIYSKQGVDADKGNKRVPLDHNHTHFVIVDDGSREKYGGEIEFRANLEKTISSMQCGPTNNQVNTPVISIILEGGIGSMKTVSESIKNGIPVLVLQGSGRAADFIAHGYYLSKDITNEDRSHFDKNYRDTMEQMATNCFEWKPGEINKPAKIATCLKQLESSLRQRKMITVFNLNDSDNKEFDKAILNALLKASKSNQSAQLSLALAWNRSDIAKNEIFSSAKRNIFGGQLHDAMTTALIQNRTEFVKLFLENGVELQDFLNIKNLWNLYANCLNDKSDSAAQLLNNLIMYLKQTWGAYLCCRPVENLGNQPDLVRLVGKALIHLLGDEAMNPYKDDRFEISSSGLVPTMGYIKDKSDKEKSFSGKFWQRVTYDLQLPEKDLMLWAVLLNRMDLAKLFWRLGKNHIGTALLAASILKGLAEVADDDEEIELSLELEEHALEFESLAVNVLSHCYKQNKAMAHQLLVRQLTNCGNSTLLLMADANEMMDFMDHTCCQTKLNNVWKGRMALYTSTFKIVSSMFLPFLIPAIKFTSNKDPTAYLDDDEESDLDESEEGIKEGDHILSSKVAPVPESSSHAKFLKKKLYQVSLMGQGKEGISVMSALYYFYTAPVTKFWWYTIAYIFFLCIFTYFVLTNLHPVSHADSPSILEYITWGWTVTMVIEEVRQIVTRDQRSLWYKLRSWYSNVWNKFDLLMYLLFLLSVILRFTLDDSNFSWARMTYSITLAMYYLRFMQTFFVEKNIGPKVIMIRKMLTDLMFFFAILVVFVLSFGTAYQANLFPNAPASWSLLKQVVYLPYWQMYGELFIENAEGTVPEDCTTNETVWRELGTMERCAERTALVPLLLAIYMLVTNILLVNLLIAMFSDTFQKVQDNSLKVWRFYKFSLVYEYYERPTLFPPFIILNHLFRGVRWCLYKRFHMLNYHDDFKLHLVEKDDIRLTLFERDAAEEFLHTSNQLKREELESKVSTTAERIEKVIDELDNIKESVNQTESRKDLGASVPVIDATPRDVGPISTRTPKAAPLGPSIEDQMEQLSSFVREEMAAMNKKMIELQTLLLETNKRQQTTMSQPTSSGGRVLDIEHVTGSSEEL